MWCLDEYLLLCGRWTERLHRRHLQPAYQISRGSPHTPEARLHPLDVLLAPAQTRHAETLPRTLRKGALPERNVPRCPERRRATARMPSPSRPPQGMLPDAARWLCWQSMRVEPRIALMLLAACSGGAEDRLLGWHLCAQHRHRLREHALARARRPDGLWLQGGSGGSQGPRSHACCPWRHAVHLGTRRVTRACRALSLKCLHCHSL